MKNKIVLFVVSCVVVVLSSCLDSDENTMEITANCQISSFSLSHDSIPGLEDVDFTIDQITGRIFNIDSLPYGTEIEKVVCNIGLANSYAVVGVEVSPEAYPDSTYYLSSMSDSIDFSAPVRFVIHAYDNYTTKVYVARVNIHQLVPDSMVWSKYADPMLDMAIKEQKVVTYDYDGSESYFMYVKPTGSNASYALYRTSVENPEEWTSLPLSGLPSDGLRISQITEYNQALYVPGVDGTLYVSVDGRNWSVVEDTPSVRAVLGEVKASDRNPSALATIVDKEGTLTFYAMNQAGEWLEGETVSPDFPVTGFGNLQYSVMYHEYLLLAGGRNPGNQVVNTTWSTMNGTSWALMTSGDETSFSDREGAMVAYYDDKFFLIGGIDASNKALKDVYQSIDYGITWSLQDSMVVLPADYEARGYSSIIVDEENFVNLFGGRTSVDANDLNQLWRGRINRLLPKE